MDLRHSTDCHVRSVTMGPAILLVVGKSIQGLQNIEVFLKRVKTTNIELDPKFTPPDVNDADALSATMS